MRTSFVRPLRQCYESDSPNTSGRPPRLLAAACAAPGGLRQQHRLHRKCIRRELPQRRLRSEHASSPSDLHGMPGVRENLPGRRGGRGRAGRPGGSTRRWRCPPNIVTHRTPFQQMGPADNTAPLDPHLKPHQRPERPARSSRVIATPSHSGRVARPQTEADSETTELVTRDGASTAPSVTRGTSMRRRDFIHAGLLCGLALLAEAASPGRATAQPSTSARGGRREANDNDPCASGNCGLEYESRSGRSGSLGAAMNFHMRRFGRRGRGYGRRSFRGGRGGRFRGGRTRRRFRARARSRRR